MPAIDDKCAAGERVNERVNGPGSRFTARTLQWNHFAVTIHVTQRVSNMNTKVRTLVSGDFRTGGRRVDTGPEEAMAL